MVGERPHSSGEYETRGGVGVRVDVDEIDGEKAIDGLVEGLDTRLGCLLSSSYEYPGRYTRWDLGFIDPPLVFFGSGRDAQIEPLNDRGSLLIGPVAARLQSESCLEDFGFNHDKINLRVQQSTERFPEEERSRQPSLFSILRALIDFFGSDRDPHLGFYGAFGYDLALQFEPIDQRLEREPNARDLVLYLPDEIFVVNHRREMDSDLFFQE